MNITDLNLGSSILVDVERAGIIYTLKSKVMDSGDGGITISPPYDSKGTITEFRERDKIAIRYVERTKILRWGCTEWKDVLIEGQKYLYLASSGVAENGNKREALRISVAKEVSLKSVGTPKFNQVILKDISHTGVGFVTTDVLDKSETFELLLEDLNLTTLLRIKIVREEKLAKGNLYGCLITKSDATLRKYIAGRQQEELRKLREKENLEVRF